MPDTPALDWYLKEWLKHLRRSVTWFEERVGWTHSITSRRVNRKANWNRNHLAQAAEVLGIAPHELLMHPLEAEHIRRLRKAMDEEYQLKVAEQQRPFALNDDGKLRARKAG